MDHGGIVVDDLAHATEFFVPGRAGEHAGIRHLAFAADDIEAAVAGLRARGSAIVGEHVRYENSYWLCYVRRPEGIIVELAEKIG